MRVEFQDLITQNENLSVGLSALSHLLEIAENADEYNNVSGVPELLNLLCQASRKQTHDMKFVFDYTEREQR